MYRFRGISQKCNENTSIRIFAISLDEIIRGLRLVCFAPLNWDTRISQFDGNLEISLSLSEKTVQCQRSHCHPVRSDRPEPIRAIHRSTFETLRAALSDTSSSCPCRPQSCCIYAFLENTVNALERSDKDSNFASQCTLCQPLMANGVNNYKATQR